MNPLRAQTSFSFKDLMGLQGKVRRLQCIQLFILIKYLKEVILNNHWKYSTQESVWSKFTQHVIIQITLVTNKFIYLRGHKDVGK